MLMHYSTNLYMCFVNGRDLGFNFGLYAIKLGIF